MKNVKNDKNHENHKSCIFENTFVNSGSQKGILEHEVEIDKRFPWDLIDIIFHQNP